MTRMLLLPSWAFLAALLLHDLDHLRQGRPIEAPVVVLGILSEVAAIALIVLAMRRSRFAPHGATLVGVATALGFVLVHVLPDWGPLSDGYPGAPVDAWSWALVAVPMAAALWLGLAGARGLRTDSARALRSTGSR